MTDFQSFMDQYDKIISSYSLDVDWEIIKKILESKRDILGENYKTFHDYFQAILKSDGEINKIIDELQKSEFSQESQLQAKKLHVETMKLAVNIMAINSQQLLKLLGKKDDQIDKLLRAFIAKTRNINEYLTKIDTGDAALRADRKIRDDEGLIEKVVGQQMVSIKRIEVTPIVNNGEESIESNKKKFIAEFFKEKGDPDGIISNFFRKIYCDLNILNTSLFLKFMTLLQNKELTVDCMKSMGFDEGSISNSMRNFFYVIPESTPKKFFINEKINEIIERDTVIINNYVKNDKQNIFVMNLISDIRKNKLDNLFNRENYPYIVNMTDYLIKVVEQIINFYNIIMGQYTIVTKRYNEMKKIQIMSYVKIRQDDKKNPRFEYSVKDNSLFIKYYNSPDPNKTSDKQLPKDYSEEYYYFGPYDDIFTGTNKEIADKLNIIKQKLLEKQNICVIGYGQSGAGKTATLIYHTKGKDNEKEGVLMNLCNDNRIMKQYNNITVKIVELVTNYGHSEQFKPEDYVVKNYNGTEFITAEQKGKIFKNEGKWMADGISLGDYINTAFNKRIVEPTPNNPDSSRSHIIIDINFDSEVHMIICDLAGVENKFVCSADDLEEVKNFMDKYQKSEKYKGKKFLYDQYHCDNANDNKLIKYVEDNNGNVKKISDLEREKIIAGQQLKYDAVECVKSNPNNVLNYTNINNANLKLVKNEKDIQKDIIENIRYLLFLKIVFRDIKKISDSSHSRMVGKIVRESESFFDNKPKFKEYNFDRGYILDQFNDLYQRVSREKKETETDTHITKLIDFTEYKPPSTKKEGSFVSQTRFKDPDNLYKTLKKETVGKLLNNIKMANTISQILYNCELRRIEGYMINNSLQEMRNTIKNIIYANLGANKIKPLIQYDAEIPFCVNAIIDIDKYDKFNEILFNSSARISSKIIDIINTFGVNVEALDFVIFTVINLSDNANNPPNIPYVNISNLKYHYYAGNLDDKTIQELKDKLNKNSFYNKLNEESTIKKLIKKDKYESKDLQQLINEIDNINALTLIGSLEATSKIKYLFGDNITCSNTIINNGKCYPDQAFSCAYDECYNDDKISREQIR